MGDFLVIELYEALVNNPVRSDLATKVELELINSTGRINIKDLDSRPRSAHEFKINAEDIGFHGKYNLNKNQICIILEISLSLSNNKVLFTTIQPNQSYPFIEFGKLPSDVEIINIPGGKKITIAETIHISGNLSIVIGTKITLDETKIFEIINSLLKLKIFADENRTVYDFNVLDSIKRYTDGINSVNSITCYSALYRAFEKAVNADKERKGYMFDNEAQNLTGMSKNDIKNLREFYNRIKHAQKDRRDIIFLKSSETRFSELVLNLKKATDAVILYRVK